MTVVQYAKKYNVRATAVRRVLRDNGQKRAAEGWTLTPARIKLLNQYVSTKRS